MKIKLTLLALFAAVTFTASAQSDYSRAIGIRLGNGFYDMAAVSYKTFISKPAALEFNLGFRSTGTLTGFNYGWSTVSVAGAYQHHFDIPNVEGLKWFVGGGALLSQTFSEWENTRGLGVGIFATGGADYKFANIPLNVSADIRPTITIVEPFKHYNSFYPSVGASARYTF